MTNIIIIWASIQNGAETTRIWYDAVRLDVKRKCVQKKKKQTWKETLKTSPNTNNSHAFFHIFSFCFSYETEWLIMNYKTTDKIIYLNDSFFFICFEGKGINWILIEKAMNNQSVYLWDWLLGTFLNIFFFFEEMRWVRIIYKRFFGSSFRILIPVEKLRIWNLFLK